MNKNAQKKLISDQKWLQTSIMKAFGFFVCQKRIHNYATKQKISIIPFAYKNKYVYLMQTSKERFKQHMDLLLLVNKNKSCNVYIKDFHRFIYNKTKRKKIISV